MNIYTLFGPDGEFLGRTQAPTPEEAIAKWMRLYGEQATYANLTGSEPEEG